MLNYSPSMLLPVNVIRADELDKAKLLAHLSVELDEYKLLNARNQILGSENEVYLVYQMDRSDPITFAVTTDYTKITHSKEIIIYYPERIEDLEHFKTVLQRIVSILSEDQDNNYIILKIRDSLENLTVVAESIGFMKDGIFISNQFLEGEFTFYSVYIYKLI